MHKTTNRIKNEKKTVGVMITMYCSSRHGGKKDNLCYGCTNLLSYALIRIDNCVYGAIKPSCEKCPIHCYNDVSREQIRKIMRYSGPRMIFYHPILAFKHLIKNINSNNK
ncbi:MAG: nitrous oxide-stimulated promoter family protein [Bacteroidetes bacterium]|nr:nitrous oxide-stimulated promoter family protein [Bacteroidota bacterium]